MDFSFHDYYLFRNSGHPPVTDVITTMENVKNKLNTVKCFKDTTVKSFNKLSK